MGIVVIGGDLCAAAYAFHTGATLIQNEMSPPHPFTFLEPHVSTKHFNFENERRPMRTPDGIFDVGAPKENLWDHLVFTLALEGRVPFHGEPVKIRLKNPGLLHVVVGETTLFKYNYEKLVLFSATNVRGLPPPAVEGPVLCEVYDWFDVNQGSIHPYDLMKGEDDFIQKIFFYPSNRIDGNTTQRKDLIAISEMPHNFLFDINYSDLYARFKIIDMLKKGGITGNKRGLLQITHNKRNVKHHQDLRYEFDDDNVEFKRGVEEEWLSESIKR